MSTPPKEIFLVWIEDHDDPESSCFIQYNSIEEAIKSECMDNEKGLEIYSATPKLLGIFQMRETIIQIGPTLKAPSKKENEFKEKVTIPERHGVLRLYSRGASPRR
jgi:hypothetical protein